MEQKYVKETFDTNCVVPMGPNVNAFEQDLAAFANKVLDENEDEDEKFRFMWGSKSGRNLNLNRAEIIKDSLREAHYRA